MNREILFRGFHPCGGPDTIVVDGKKVKGRWVEGYIVKHPSAIQIGNDYSPWYIHVPPVEPDDNGGVFNVFPSTVGQYSGLNDSDGRKVFECSNPTWEPYFKDLSPTLSKLYFLTNSGTIRYIVATMIFKKMGWMERRAANWN